MKIVALLNSHPRMPKVEFRTLPLLGLSLLTSLGCWNVPQSTDPVDDSDASGGEDETLDDPSTNPLCLRSESTAEVFRQRGMLTTV